MLLKELTLRLWRAFGLPKMMSTRRYGQTETHL